MDEAIPEPGRHLPSGSPAHSARFFKPLVNEPGETGVNGGQDASRHALNVLGVFK